MGRFTGKLDNGSIEVEQEIFVAKEVHKSLLGQPAIEALGVVQRIAGIRTQKLDPVSNSQVCFKV